MQRGKGIRPPKLPFKDPPLERRLDLTAKPAIMASAGDIITKINSLRQQPNCTICPVTVRENILGDPPSAQTLVKGGKGYAKAFLIRKRILDILNNEHPERGRRQTTGNSTVHVGADVDRTG
jgi:hypothetical protein